MTYQDPACQALGIEVDEVAPGRARARMRITKEMTNGHGIAHGGYVFLLADCAFAYACNAYGPPTVAHSAHVTFLRPATADDELIAEATERARYGRNGVYDVTVTRHNGEVVAVFAGNSMTITRLPKE